MVMADKRFNWSYESEPEPFANGRRLLHPRGKGLGGSSLINGMLYARGHPRDYDEWRQLGPRGLELRGRAAVLQEEREPLGRRRPLPRSRRAAVVTKACPRRPALIPASWRR
jgi:choline dehydrogenase-like flavoprotein